MVLVGGCDGKASSPKDKSVAEGQSRAVQARDGSVSVDGARIAYRVHGDLTSGKTPLVVLHGSLMAGEAMMWLVDQFTASRPVITVDARGHGRTGDVPGPITYEQMADDTAAVLRSLGVKTADVLGYSMGGTTALVMAVRHPDLVAKQVIMSGVASRKGWHPAAQESFENWQYDMFAGTPIEAAYKRISATPDALPSLVPKLRALESTSYDLSPEALRAIRGKTMIVIGDADGVSFPETLRLFVERGGDNTYVVNQGFLTESPRARLAVLPATSHIGMTNEGPLIAQLVTPFLDDRAPAPPSGFFEGMDKPAETQEVGES
jgi:pimeloyl-ACP methyl ester carboxylesterase